LLNDAEKHLPIPDYNVKHMLHEWRKDIIINNNNNVLNKTKDNQDR